MLTNDEYAKLRRRYAAKRLSWSGNISDVLQQAHQCEADARLLLAEIERLRRLVPAGEQVEQAVMFDEVIG